MKIMFEQAAYEAIYWWNRDEYYYHKLFKNILEISKDQNSFNVFKDKVFEIFLRQYSIRRNLKSGNQTIDMFLNQLIELSFFERVIEGDTSVIDNCSSALKAKSLTTEKETRSLLSKTAFLVNPAKFSLYDTLAKNGLWEIIKPTKMAKRNQLNSYSKFIELVDILLNMNRNEILKTNNFLSGLNLRSTEFLKDNPEVYFRRIFDKFLWLKASSGTGRDYHSSDFRNFICLGFIN